MPLAFPIPHSAHTVLDLMRLLSIFFYLCPKIKLLWIQIKKYFLPEIVLPQLDSYNAVLGFPSSTDMLACNLHLIFKIYVYKNRENKKCNLNGFLNKVKLIKNIENHLSFAKISGFELEINFEV